MSDKSMLKFAASLAKPEQQEETEKVAEAIDAMSIDELIAFLHPKTEVEEAEVEKVASEEPKTSTEKTAMADRWGRELARAHFEKQALDFSNIGGAIRGAAAKAAPVMQSMAGRAATAMFHSSRGQRAAVMGLAGAGAGALAAGKGNRMRGAAMGGAVGAAAGAMTPNSMAQRGASGIRNAMNIRPGGGAPGASPIHNYAASNDLTHMSQASQQTTPHEHVAKIHSQSMKALTELTHGPKPVTPGMPGANTPHQPNAPKYPPNAPYVTNSGSPAQAAGLPNKLTQRDSSKTNVVPPPQRLY